MGTFVLGMLTTYVIQLSNSEVVSSKEIAFPKNNIASRNPERVISETNNIGSNRVIASANHQQAIDSLTDVAQLEPSLHQKLLAEEIISRLSDPNYIKDHTYLETIEGLKMLTEEQIVAVRQEIATLMQQGKLELVHFKRPEIPRHQTVTEGAQLPDPADELAYENIMFRLETNRTDGKKILLTDLVNEVQTLPPSLKQELADKITTMINNGELDMGELMGPVGQGLVGDNKDIKLFIN